MLVRLSTYFIHQDNLEDNRMDYHSSGSSHEYASEHEDEEPSSDESQLEYDNNTAVFNEYVSGPKLDLQRLSEEEHPIPSLPNKRNVLHLQFTNSNTRTE